MHRLRDVLFLVMVGLFIASGQLPVATFHSLEQCDVACGPAEDCEKPCLVDLFENTCGGYGGPPVDPMWGNCIGECGDTFCNPYNNEDAETCWADCGSCGDSVCSGPENMVGTQHYCCVDCHSNPNECVGTGGSCEDHGACGMGEGCNKAGSCCSVNALFDPWPESPETACAQNCLGGEDCQRIMTQHPSGEIWGCISAGVSCFPE